MWRIIWLRSNILFTLDTHYWQEVRVRMDVYLDAIRVCLKVIMNSAFLIKFRLLAILNKYFCDFSRIR